MRPPKRNIFSPGAKNSQVSPAEAYTTLTVSPPLPDTQLTGSIPPLRPLARTRCIPHRDPHPHRPLILLLPLLSLLDTFSRLLPPRSTQYRLHPRLHRSFPHVRRADHQSRADPHSPGFTTVLDPTDPRIRRLPKPSDPAPLELIFLSLSLPLSVPISSGWGTGPLHASITPSSVGTCCETGVSSQPGIHFARDERRSHASPDGGESRDVFG